MGFVSKLLSFGADKDIKRYEKLVTKINALEPEMEKKSDPELRKQTELFRKRYNDGQGESLDDLLPEAFATVREASRRTLGMRHFDVQLIGAMALHEGQIAEMKTGEGKTLVSTLAGYLNAIPGKGVHIVTVNDYLAKRDSEWMGQIYKFLGMSVGLLQNGMPLEAKGPAYQADVTYGTNSEFGFDYLRDNMVVRADQRVQRGHVYAIVDEVDSILIDEARTPLIISGEGTKSAKTYLDFARALKDLHLERGEEVQHDMLSASEDQDPTGDYVMDEAKHTIAATEQGLEKIERYLKIDNIYADLSGELVNHLQQALKAEYMFHRDKQYVVAGDEVKIVDEFTGRIMEGRRYSEGLHQAIEAKENLRTHGRVTVREENQTLATITLQNYFRLYDKLSGMTGTALTEDAEFREIYKLPVQVIPTNRPVKRKDLEDVVYRTIDAKFDAVAADIIHRHEQGQPVLVGTVSIESSERLSRLLNERGIEHQTLNAKFHEREAHIVAQAGRRGAVTIATNMAGRGTDILLGGNPDELAREELAGMDLGLDRETLDNLLQLGDLSELSATAIAQTGVEVTPEALAAVDEVRDRYRELCRKERAEVLEAGGLAVIGTERHESRRIDNQLRGRAGRQGDPGSTQFYLLLEVDLMRLFGGERMEKIAQMMVSAGMEDDEPIEKRIISKAIERAQRKVEDINRAMRKNVLEYDDVMNKQRQVIYAERNKILDGKDLTSHVDEVIADTVKRCVAEFCPKGASDDARDLEGLHTWLVDLTGDEDAPDFSDGESTGDLDDQVLAYVKDAYTKRTSELGEELTRYFNTQVMLRVIDTRWKNYLQEMDYLKQGIGLRGFGQRDPLVEYKSEAFRAFHILVDTMYEDYVRTMLRAKFRAQEIPVRQEEPAPLAGATYSGPADTDGEQADSTVRTQVAMRDVHAPSPTTEEPESQVKTYRKDLSDPYANVGRNDPCPCGSGKKFKNCHGRNR